MKIANVAAIIVTWNKLQDVCLLLDDLAKLSLNNIHLDIYVVDNASTDGTPAYIQQNYPQVKLLQTGTNLGGSGGFSHGLKTVSQLEYDYLWLLDNDVRLETLALSFLVETLQTYEEVGLVGSQIRKLDDPNTLQEVGIFINFTKAHIKNNFGNSPVTSNQELLKCQPYLVVDACAAASLLVRRIVVQKIGVFEDYFLHFDDIEWCLRAKANWVVAVNPSSIVWHPSPDSKSRPWISYYDERNVCYCWQKHQPNLVLKRVLVNLPRLMYNSLTGRYFLSQVAILGFEDFIKGIRGKMPGTLPYKEVSLTEVIDKPAKVIVQSVIYQDKCQGSILQKMEQNKQITFLFYPKNIVVRIYLWIIACFWKPVDVALVNCVKPDLYALNLAKNVYYFTGNGYVRSNVSVVSLIKKLFITIVRVFRIYWKIKTLPIQ
ncbi:MAG TPA: glycosyltransferase family 2 protein [Oculatellaceae cyanobacterium]